MDNIFKEVGEYGKYQKVQAVLLVIAGCFPSAFVAYIQVFASASPDHWCRVPELIELGLTIDARKQLSIPKVLKDGVFKYSQCEMYALNYSLVASQYKSGLNATFGNAASVAREAQRRSCNQGWEYDNSHYDDTLVTAFDLVCDQGWWPSFCTSVFYAGGILGNVVFGWISDRYGRRIAFHINLVCVVVLSVASAFSPNYTVFIIFRFLIGFQFPAIFQIPFIILLEITSSNYRTAMGMLMNIGFGLAITLLGAIAYLTRHWFILTLVTSAPFTVMAFYWWLVPESPRWLISQNRMVEAEINLKRIAKTNQKTISQGILHQYDVRDEPNASNTYTSPKTLFQTPNMCKKTCVVMFIFVTNAMCYTGLNYMTANLGVSDYLAFAISGFVEAPSCLLTWYAMNKWGRRWTTTLTMMFVGLCCTGNMFVPEDAVWLNVLLPSFGKFLITGSFSIIYVYGGELLPTVVRANGMALCAVICAIGNLTVPYVVYLVKYSRVLPLLIMGCMSILGSLGSIILPETLHTELPDTLAQGEEFGRNMSYFSWTTKKSKRKTQQCGSVKKSDEVNGII